MGLTALQAPGAPAHFYREANQRRWGAFPYARKLGFPAQPDPSTAITGGRSDETGNRGDHVAPCPIPSGVGQGAMCVSSNNVVKGVQKKSNL